MGFSMEFVNLYVQTEYSILQSAISLSSLFGYAKDNNINELAIADMDMYGVYKFYQGCIENNIKPIIGLCLDLNPKDLKGHNKDYLLLYASNLKGYLNLCHLSSIKQIEGFGEDKYAVLKKYSDGLIAVLPGLESKIVQGFNKSGDDSNYLDNVLFMNSIYQELFIGMDWQTPLSKEIFNELYVFNKAHNFKMVALNKTSFLEKDDYELYCIIKKISLISSNGGSFEATSREINSFYLNDELANHLFVNYPDLMNNTRSIAQMVDLEIPKEGYHFPKFYLTDGKGASSNDYLSSLAKMGLNKRLSDKNVDASLTNVYKERLLYELSVITKMGFSDYFLIVYDYVRFAKTSGILVGPGRGSGAGSLVSYSLGITNTDPIEYNLLFERFLNPERVTMPDIDVDFPDDARDKIYEYLCLRYGKDKVAHIGTFGTFKPRSAIRDVAKVLGIKENVVSIINNYIPVYNSPSLKNIASGVNDIKRMIESDDEIAKLFFFASRIENMPRNVSTHASGIVIGDVSLENYTPLSPGLNGIYQTQYEASDIEDIGLVKMDILSLANLNTIDTIIKQIEVKLGIKIDINKINYNDQKVFSLMASGDTDGIFQFESKGMRKVLKDLKVSSIEDMIIANAIYRPGPQEMIPVFLKRKAGEKYNVLSKAIASILEPTYGIIIFQEQIMMIAKAYAGFSLGQADLLRRAVSKKKGEELHKMRARFVSGAISLNHSEDEANKIYDYIVKFGDYGFNRSHAAVYSIVAYQMAYLKTYYYPFFMGVLMENSLGDKEKMASYLVGLKQKRYEVLPPDINISSTSFEVTNNYIYYPLQGVKDISLGIANDILKIRQDSLFNNYEDFLERTKGLLNKKMVISLAYAGAFDNLGITRKSAVYEYDNIISRLIYNKSIGDKLMGASYGTQEFDLATISEFEKQALGFNIKYNEFIQFNDLIRRYSTVKLANLHLGNNIVLAKVERKNEYNSKNGLMVFLGIVDDTMAIDVTIFASDYLKFKDQIEVSSYYILEIVMNIKEDVKRYHVTNLKKL